MQRDSDHHRRQMVQHPPQQQSLQSKLLSPAAIIDKSSCPSHDPIASNKDNNKNNRIIPSYNLKPIISLQNNNNFEDHEQLHEEDYLLAQQQQQLRRSEQEQEKNNLYDIQGSMKSSLLYNSSGRRTPRKASSCFKHANLPVLIPNEEQERIICEKRDSHMQIKACAGSGKTTTILRRVKYLCESERVNPERILITAFNIEAARSVKEKLARLVSDRIEKQITINNIDKLSKLWVSATKRFNMDTLNVREYTTKLVAVMKSDAAFLARITGLFDFIFFDEFQDINPDEYELLRLFASHNTIITFVGDDAQNIYSFRESKAEVSPEQLREDFPGIVQHALTTNYRSTQPIVEFANQILANSRHTHHQTSSTYKSLVMTSARGTTSSIPNTPTALSQDQLSSQQQQLNNRLPEFTRFMSVAEQNDTIISSILELVELGYKLDSIAVLSRTNKPLQFLEEALEIYNNKFEKSKGNQFNLELTPAATQAKRVPLPFIAHITDNKEKQAKGVKLMKSNPAGAASSAQANSNTNNNSASKKLTLTTIHKSKGLEWDVVFLIGLNDDFFPGTNKDKEEEEERRVFYVGVTRAKFRLEMSFIWSKKNQNMTRFVTEIDGKFYTGFTQAASSDQPRCNEQMRIVDKLKSKTILLSETIEFLTKDHYEELRRLGCLQIPKQTMQIHFKCNLGQYIIENNLVVEFATFFKTYILRSISEEITRDAHTTTATSTPSKPKSGHSQSTQKSSLNGFNNKYCESVLFSSSSLMSSSDRNGLAVSALIPNISVQAGGTAGSSEFGPSEMMTSSFISDQAKREEILRSLIAFQDKSNACDSILKHIYNVAMCSSIFHQRKRLLHKEDAFKHFELNKNILKNARKTFLPEVFKSYPLMQASMCRQTRGDNQEELPSTASIQVNESIYSDQFQLKADFDVVTNDTIFEIRFQQNQLLTPEDTIELLAKAAIYACTAAAKEKQEESHVGIPRYLVVYYPLQGELISLDILEHGEKLDSILSILFAARLEKQEAACAADSANNRSNPPSANGSQVIITSAMLGIERSTKIHNSQLEGSSSQKPSTKNIGSRDTHECQDGGVQYDNANHEHADKKGDTTDQTKRHQLTLFDRDTYTELGDDLESEHGEERNNIQSNFDNRNSNQIRIGGVVKESKQSTSSGITKNVFKNRESRPALNSESGGELESGPRNTGSFAQSNRRSQQIDKWNSSTTRDNSVDALGEQQLSKNRSERESSFKRQQQQQQSNKPSESGSAKMSNLSEIPQRKQSITSTHTKVINSGKPDTAMMQMIVRPTIGGKANQRTTTKADSCEYFKSKYGQFPTKYGNSNHPF